MLRRLVRVMRRLKDERGAILIYFTLALLPLLAVGGAAMDLGHVFLVKQRLTNAVDSASLALGARNNLSSQQATDLVTAFIRTRYSGSLKTLAVSDTATQVSVSVTVQVPMTFMQVLNTSSVDVTVSATAVRPQGKLEIALVLDQTGSMAGDKINNLKLAAKDLIDVVVWDNQTADYYSKVAIVPYAAGVNVDVGHDGGITNTVRGLISLGCFLLGCDKFTFQTASPGTTKTFNISPGCVSERTGPQAYTDVAPSPIALVGPNYPPSGDPCPSNSITPLTNDKTLLKSQIDLLQAAGSTAGHIGVAWGWYLLSPNWGYLWPDLASRPAPYSDLALLDASGRPLLRKIVILMTDGEFNTGYCQGVISHDSTSGSNSDHIWCNAPNGSSFNQSRSLCTNMKASGILVYTIGFNLTQQSARDLMTNCATDASHAYLASTGDGLRQVFREIATRIASLRLTH
jgi:Flp pilus assembly protein TadG